jgi:hypothetical protein
VAGRDPQARKVPLVRRFGANRTNDVAFTNDERELLRRVTVKFSPEVETLVDAVGRRTLTDEEREVLRGALAHELSSLGLRDDSEPNEYGKELDDLIGRLMFF